MFVCTCIAIPIRVLYAIKITINYTGADPGFQVRRGALKKFAPSGGSRQKFWGISCEKS